MLSVFMAKTLDLLITRHQQVYVSKILDDVFWLKG